MSRERKTNPRLKIKRSIVPTILQTLAQPRTARNSWLEAGWPRRKMNGRSVTAMEGKGVNT
jgi:hypothetical protein